MTHAHTTCRITIVIIIIIVINVVVIVVVIIPVITFMQGMYNYTPETKHVSRVYSVAAVLNLQFVLHVMLFHQWNIIIIIIIIIKHMGYAGIWTKIVCITGTIKQSRHLFGSHIGGGDAYSEVFLDSPPCNDGMCQEGHCWLLKKT